MAGPRRTSQKDTQKPAAKPRISRWAADGLNAFEEAGSAEAVADVKKTCADFITWASEIHQESPQGTVPFLRKMIEAYELTGKTAACFATKEFLDWVSSALGLFQTYFLEVKEASVDHLYSVEDSEADDMDKGADAKERASRENNGARIYQWRTLGLDAFEPQTDSDITREKELMDGFKTWMMNDQKKSQNAAKENARHLAHLFHTAGKSFAAIASDEFSDWGKEFGPDGEPNVNKYAKTAVKMFSGYFKEGLKESLDHLYRAGDGAVASDKPAKPVASEKPANEVGAATEDAAPKEADPGKTRISQWATLGLDAFEPASSSDDKEIGDILDDFRTYLSEVMGKTERSTKDSCHFVRNTYHRLGKSIACFCTAELIDWGRAKDSLGEFNLPRATTGAMRAFQTFLIEQKKRSAAHLYAAKAAADVTNGEPATLPAAEPTAAPSSAKRKASDASGDASKKQRAEGAEEEDAAIGAQEGDSGLGPGAEPAADKEAVRAANPTADNGEAKPEPDPSKPLIAQWETLGLGAFKAVSAEEEKEFPDVMTAFRTWSTEVRGRSASTVGGYIRHLEKVHASLGRATVCFATDEFHNWGKTLDASGSQRLSSPTLYGMKLFQAFWREMKDNSVLDNLYKLG